MRTVSPLLNWTWFEWVIVRGLRDGRLDHSWGCYKLILPCNRIGLYDGAISMRKNIKSMHVQPLFKFNCTSSRWSAKLYLRVRELEEKRFRAVYDLPYSEISCVDLWLTSPCHAYVDDSIHSPATTVAHWPGYGPRAEHEADAMSTCKDHANDLSILETSYHILNYSRSSVVRPILLLLSKLIQI
jgi:hypothetical protein